MFHLNWRGLISANVGLQFLSINDVGSGALVYPALFEKTRNPSGVSYHR